MMQAEPLVTTVRVEKKTRRTQGERSASTRARIIDATQHLLYTRGYSGATTLAIRDAAGLSMGALQHQFPTKAKLMAAALQNLVDARIATYRKALRSGKTPMETVALLLDTSFEVMRTPMTTAMLEILLARRNDPELDEETGPIFARMDRRVRRWGRRLTRNAGITDPDKADRLRLMNNAFIRGMAIELISNTQEDQIESAMALWRETYLKLLVDD